MYGQKVFGKGSRNGAAAAAVEALGWAGDQQWRGGVLRRVGGLMAGCGGRGCAEPENGNG